MKILRAKVRGLAAAVAVKQPEQRDARVLQRALRVLHRRALALERADPVGGKEMHAVRVALHVALAVGHRRAGDARRRGARRGAARVLLIRVAGVGLVAVAQYVAVAAAVAVAVAAVAVAVAVAVVGVAPVPVPVLVGGRAVVAPRPLGLPGPRRL